MKIRPADRVATLERTLIRRLFDRAPPDAINLGLGEPDVPTPAGVALAGAAGIAAGHTGYTATAGDPELRRAIADRYGGTPAGVVVTVGSQEALFACCLALVDPGDEILYPDPGYPAYAAVARLVGARPVPYPLTAEQRFRLRSADVEARVGGRTRAVILCSPSNPTGACVERAELERLTAFLGKRNVPWLSDEIYAAFDFEGRFVSPRELAPGGGLVVSSLSKDTCMTGWRVGWALAPPEIAPRLIAAHQYLVTCAPSVSQRAAVAAFGPAAVAARGRLVDRFRRRREVMGDELARIPGLRFERPDGAFYFFVDVSAYGDSTEIAGRALDRRGVLTIPGEAFGPGGRGYLRLSFAAPREQIRRGVRRIGEELAAGAQSSGSGLAES